MNELLYELELMENRERHIREPRKGRHPVYETELEDMFLDDLWGSIKSGFSSWQSSKIEDRTHLTPVSKRKGKPRSLDSVYALVLHQMGFRRSSAKYDRVTAHFVILADGRIQQLHPLSAYLYASNRFNKRSVAVEFAGNFPSTRGKCWKPKKNKCHTLTQAQINAGRYLIQHLIDAIDLTHVLAHRQSSGSRSNDPGPDIWYHVGQWAINKYGLDDGGPGFAINKGRPIPSKWRTWGA